MKLNKILPISLCVISAIAVSCQNDYDANGSCTDVAWYTSETVAQGNDYITVSVDSFISFKDLSMGCKSHKWVIEDGAKFMIDKFDYKKGMVNQIDPNKGLESKNVTESVFFGKVGKTKVTLIDTFDQWVTSHDKTPVEAEWNGNTWLLTKEFVVDVYDKLYPAFSVSTKDGEVLKIEGKDEVPTDQSTWTTITVYTGDVITFTDNTTLDRPTGRMWNITGSDQKTSDETEAKFTFSKANPTGYTGFTMVSKREIPASSAKKVIPLKIIVKESPLRALTEQISFIDANTISIPTNSKGLSAIPTSAISDFTVSAKSAGGANVAASIKSVSVDATTTGMLVEFNQSFDKGDIVTMAYKGSSIKTTTGAALPEFSGEVKCNVSSNLIDEVINSFEATGATLQDKGWSVSNASLVNIVADPDNASNHVMMYDNTTNACASGQLYAMHIGSGYFNLPAGTYTMSVKIKTNTTAVGNFELAYKTNSVIALNPITVPDEAAKGWVTLSGTFTANAPITALRLRFAKGAMKSGAKAYIDDIVLKASK